MHLDGEDRDLELTSDDAEGVQGGGLSINLGGVSAEFGGGNADIGVGSTNVHSGEDGWSVNAGQQGRQVRGKGDWGRMKGLGKRLRHK